MHDIDFMNETSQHICVLPSSSIALDGHSHWKGAQCACTLLRRVQRSVTACGSLTALDTSLPGCLPTYRALSSFLSNQLGSALNYLSLECFLPTLNFQHTYPPANLCTTAFDLIQHEVSRLHPSDQSCLPLPLQTSAYLLCSLLLPYSLPSLFHRSLTSWSTPIQLEPCVVKEGLLQSHVLLEI